MNELEVINNLKNIIKSTSALKLTDDVFYDKKKSLVASIDTYNEKIHYLDLKKPDLVIKKIIRSSISDIISKGVDPKYVLISFTGSNNHFKKKNIKLMVKSIKNEQKKYKFFLVGGDTTSSNNSSFTICSFGYSKKVVQRKKCKNNDDIYITGNIGDSSVGLSILKNLVKADKKIKSYFIDKYYCPNLAFGFHKELYKFASSSMDVSDGLLIDLSKLIDNKKFGFIIDFDLIPKSMSFNKLVHNKKISIDEHLFNGDDYQILFTAKKKYRKLILKCAKSRNQKITRIGKITHRRANYLILRGKLKKIKDYQGYIHNIS